MKHQKKHISDFRTTRYRVFYASSYFKIDLEYEIDWHTKHIKKLKDHFMEPEKYHSSVTSHHIDEQRVRHYEEHVIHSIPFHQKILDDHKKRLAAILELMPEKTYRKLVKYSAKYGDLPEYFVYDKYEKEFFFVAETMSPLKRLWINDVRDNKNICDVVIFTGAHLHHPEFHAQQSKHVTE